MRLPITSLWVLAATASISRAALLRDFLDIKADYDFVVVGGEKISMQEYRDMVLTRGYFPSWTRRSSSR